MGLAGGLATNGQGGGVSALAPTAVKTGAYTAAVSDFVPADISGGSFTVTLPTAPADQARIGIKLIAVDGSHANVLTIARGGSDVFNKADGSTSLTLSALNQGVILQYKASTGIWYVQSLDAANGQPLGAAVLGTDGKVGGPGGSALETGNAIPVLSKLYVGGHSIGKGDIGLRNTANRITAKLAQLIGATETNVAADSTGMLVPNAAPSGHLANAAGNWPSVCQGFSAARTAAPYTSPLVVAEILYGINDIAQFGPFNAALAANWQSVMFALCAAVRSGSLFAYTAASIVYGGSGTWTATASALQSVSVGNKFNPTNGATVTITVPADYDGQAVNLFFLQGCGVTPAASARYTVTVGGTQVAQVSSAGINAASQGLAGTVFPTQPFCIRLPNSVTGLTPGGGVGATIVVTFDQIVSNAFFTAWAIESNPAPLVIIADTLRSAAGYSAYAAWPYTPTDADVVALNAANAAVAAMFTDGLVIFDGADSIVAKGLSAADWLNVHPLERVTGRVASVQRAALAGALTPTVVATLGELGSI